MADTLKKVECPACESEMKKVFIENCGISIDICTEGCGGIFFDNRELNKFDDYNENADIILNELKDKEFNKVDEREIRICPVCNVPMVKMGAGRAGVEIDVCNTCGAKFLDNGELEKIRHGNFEEKKQIDDLIEDIYQKEAKSMLGADFAKSPITGNFRRFFERLVYNNIMR